MLFSALTSLTSVLNDVRSRAACHKFGHFGLIYLMKEILSMLEIYILVYKLLAWTTLLIYSVY
jgi:hypothetical protein